MRLLVPLVVMGVTLELGLRLQQKLGPLYDLDPPAIHIESISETLNHKPSLVEHTAYLGGYKIVQKHRADGTRENRLRPAWSPSGTTVLFLGDSFMQGYNDAETIPHYLWRWSREKFPRRRFHFVNGGHSSYSPSIFIPQFKQLFAKYRPDMVVIDIDETDLMDDYARYRPLTERDTDGRIVAVRPSPRLKAFIAGFDWIKRQPSYLVRLAAKIRLTRFTLPAIRREVQPDFSYLRGVPDLGEARKKMGAAVEYFEGTTRELLQTVVTAMGDPKKVLIIYHPHLEILRFGGKQIVPSSLAKLTGEMGVPFHDATDELKAAFGDSPEDYYFPKDMHFTPEGLERYSWTVSSSFFPLLSRVVP